jgi:hypothetical protein
VIGRAPALYLSPDGSFTAGLAGFRRRAGAAAIDWAICVVVYLLASIPAGIVQVLPAGGLFLAGQAVAVAPVVAYFAYFYATGSTLGMRALDVELAVAATGLPPGRMRALGRAGVALLLGASVYVLYFLLASYDEPLNGYTAFDRSLILLAIALASAGAASKLWGLVDPRRQPLDMKLFGLVVIEEIVETHPAPSPWSGLWRRAP